MSKKQAIEFSEIKVGDELTITIKAKVSRVDDLDSSIRIESPDGQMNWFYPIHFGGATFKRAVPPLVPDDAEFVTFIDSYGDHVIARKDQGGQWVDSDDITYKDTKALIEALRDPGKVRQGTVVVLDARK